MQKGDVVFGRDPECHVLLRGADVAGRHAMIEQRPEGHFIRTLAGGLSVRVNGAAVQEKSLAHGDEIELGGERMVFQFIQPEEGRGKRRAGKFHGLTFVAVTVILILQIMVLAGLFIFWRIDPILIPAEEEPVVEAPEVEITDMERMILERRLRVAEQAGRIEEEPSWSPAPFQLVPEWIVTPDPALVSDSFEPFSETGAADVLVPEEE